MVARELVFRELRPRLGRGSVRPVKGVDDRVELSQYCRQVLTSIFAREFRRLDLLVRDARDDVRAGFSTVPSVFFTRRLVLDEH